jgi:hypothetical protein
LKKEKFAKKLAESPINYFSDLFVVAMVIVWIVTVVIMMIAAIAVTAFSMFLSYKTQVSCIDIGMWSIVQAIVAIPLSAGGALWMIKNAVQHALMNKQGKQCELDFPKVSADGEDDGSEKIVEPVVTGESEVAV